MAYSLGKFLEDIMSLSDNTVHETGVTEREMALASLTKNLEKIKDYVEYTDLYTSYIKKNPTFKKNLKEFFTSGPGKDLLTDTLVFSTINKFPQSIEFFIETVPEIISQKSGISLSAFDMQTLRAMTDAMKAIKAKYKDVKKIVNDNEREAAIQQLRRQVEELASKIAEAVSYKIYRDESLAAEDWKLIKEIYNEILPYATSTEAVSNIYNTLVYEKGISDIHPQKPGVKTSLATFEVYKKLGECFGYSIDTISIENEKEPIDTKTALINAEEVQDIGRMQSLKHMMRNQIKKGIKEYLKEQLFANIDKYFSNLKSVSSGAFNELKMSLLNVFDKSSTLWLSSVTSSRYGRERTDRTKHELQEDIVTCTVVVNVVGNIRKFPIDISEPVDCTSIKSVLSNVMHDVFVLLCKIYKKPLSQILRKHGVPAGKLFDLLESHESNIEDPQTVRLEAIEDLLKFREGVGSLKHQIDRIGKVQAVSHIDSILRALENVIGSKGKLLPQIAGYDVNELFSDYYAAFGRFKKHQDSPYTEEEINQIENLTGPLAKTTQEILQGTAQIISDYASEIFGKANVSDQVKQELRSILNQYDIPVDPEITSLEQLADIEAPDAETPQEE